MQSDTGQKKDLIPDTDLVGSGPFWQWCGSESERIRNFAGSESEKKFGFGYKFGS
jgi:hypothetical protein